MKNAMTQYTINVLKVSNIRDDLLEQGGNTVKVSWKYKHNVMETPAARVIGGMAIFD